MGWQKVKEGKKKKNLEPGLIPALRRQRQADFWVQGQPGLQSEFQDSQSYTEKPFLEKTTTTTTKKKKKPKKPPKQQQKNEGSNLKPATSKF